MRTSVTKQTPKPSLPTPNARHLELRPATLSSQKAKPAAGSQTSFASKSKPPSNSLDCNHIFHPHTHNRPFSCFLTPITIQLPLLTGTPVLPLTPPAPEPRRSPLRQGCSHFLSRRRSSVRGQRLTNFPAPPSPTAGTASTSARPRGPRHAEFSRTASQGVPPRPPVADFLSRSCYASGSPADLFARLPSWFRDSFRGLPRRTPGPRPPHPPLHPRPSAQPQPQRGGSSPTTSSSASYHLFSAAPRPTSGPARLAPPRPPLRPGSQALQLVPGARGLPTLGSGSPLHPRPAPPKARRHPPRPPPPPPSPSSDTGSPAGPPSLRTTHPLWWEPGGRAPQHAAPQHAPVPPPLPPGRPRWRPDPHRGRARLAQTPHSPRVGLLRHGADSQGLPAGSGRARRRGDERATGSLGPRAEGAAAARRWLPRSLARRAGGPGRLLARRPGSEAARSLGPGRGGLRSRWASLTGGGGGGSAAALNSTWRRRR